MGKVDWKEVEASLLGKSDQVSITRLNSADISEDFKKELEKYGLSVPAEQTVTLEQPVGVEGDLLKLQIGDVFKALSLLSERVVKFKLDSDN